MGHTQRMNRLVEVLPLEGQRVLNKKKKWKRKRLVQKRRKDVTGGRNFSGSDDAEISRVIKIYRSVQTREEMSQN